MLHLNAGVRWAFTSTGVTVRGLRPTRASLDLTEKAPKHRSSDTTAVFQGIGELIQDNVHELVDVLQIEMAVTCMKPLDQF